MSSGLALTVDVSSLLGASSDIYGIRYLRVIGFCLMSQCNTGPARESKVCPTRSWMEENKPAHLALSIRVSMFEYVTFVIVTFS